MTYKVENDWECFLIHDLDITFQGEKSLGSLETKLKSIETELFRRYLKSEYHTYHLLKILGSDVLTVEDIVGRSKEESKKAETKSYILALKIRDSLNLDRFVSHHKKDDLYYFLPTYLGVFVEEGLVEKMNKKYRATKSGLYKLKMLESLLKRYMNLYKTVKGKKFGYFGF